MVAVHLRNLCRLGRRLQRLSLDKIKPAIHGSIKGPNYKKQDRESLDKPLALEAYFFVWPCKTGKFDFLGRDPVQKNNRAKARLLFLFGCLPGLFACEVVAYRKGSAAFGATACKHLAAVFGRHSFAEAMLVDSAAVGGLESTFHCYYKALYLILWLPHGATPRKKKNILRGKQPQNYNIFFNPARGERKRVPQVLKSVKLR